MNAAHPWPLPYGPPNPRGGAKPPLPPTVQNAFYLMLGGAVLQVVGVVVALTQTGRVRSSFSRTDASPSTTNALSAVFVVLIVFFGAIEVGVWIWMAYKNKAGRPWARVVATVFFGLSCISVVSSVLSLAFRSSLNSMNTNTNGSTHSTSVSFTGASTVLGTIVTVLMWGVGLAAIILLWRRRSSDYFVPALAPAPAYGFPPPPGYAPGQPGAYPQAPYPNPGHPGLNHPPPGYPPTGYSPPGYSPDGQGFTPPPVADPPRDGPEAEEGFRPPE
jgi:hypothetical protein